VVRLDEDVVYCFQENGHLHLSDFSLDVVIVSSVISVNYSMSRK